MRSRVIYLCWLAILWRNRTGSGSLAHVIGVAEACQCQRKPFVLRTRARQQRLHEGLPVAVRSDRAPKWVGSGGMVSAQCYPSWKTRKSCDVHALFRADCPLCPLSFGPCLQQLRHTKDSDGVAFKKEWNQKFAWFTQSKECQKITTIHGAKNSMTHTCSGFSRHPH